VNLRSRTLPFSTILSSRARVGKQRETDQSTDLDRASLESLKDGLADAMAATDEMEDLQEEDSDTTPRK
jgi:hypothetical protein